MQLNRSREELARSLRRSGNEALNSQRAAATKDAAAQAVRECDKYKTRISQLEIEARDRELQLEKIYSELLATEQSFNDSSRQISTLKKERDMARLVRCTRLHSAFTSAFCPNSLTMVWEIRSENSTSKRELDGIRSGMQSLKEMVREMEDKAEQEANAAEHARKRTAETQVRHAPPLKTSFHGGMLA